MYKIHIRAGLMLGRLLAPVVAGCGGGGHRRRRGQSSSRGAARSRADPLRDQPRRTPGFG
jgi:hypothetical protein